MKSRKVISKDIGMCPVCHSTHLLDPSADTFEVIGKSHIVIERECRECGSTWKDVFKLERRDVSHNGSYDKAMTYWAGLIRNSPSGEDMDELMDKLLMACPGGTVAEITDYLDRAGFENHPNDTAKAFFGHYYKQVEDTLLNQYRQNNAHDIREGLSVYFSMLEDKDLEKESVAASVDFLVLDNGSLQRVSTGLVQMTRWGQFHGFQEVDKVNPVVKAGDLPRRE